MEGESLERLARAYRQLAPEHRRVIGLRKVDPPAAIAAIRTSLIAGTSAASFALDTSAAGLSGEIFATFSASQT